MIGLTVVLFLPFGSGELEVLFFLEIGRHHTGKGIGNEMNQVLWQI